MSTLSTLFLQALATASKGSNLPSIQEEAQNLIRQSLNDLQTVWTGVHALSLFSINETLDDLSTRNLIYLAVPFVMAEMETRTRSDGPHERLLTLNHTKAHLMEMISWLSKYEIIPEDETRLWSNTASLDPTKRRETKIRQFQMERAIRAPIEQFIHAKGHQYSTELDMIAALFAIISKEDEDDEGARQVAILLCRLLWSQAYSLMQSIEDESTLLKTATVQNTEQSSEADEMWRLESPIGPKGWAGPLLDPRGKPLRPFTILPSSGVDRTRIQAEVFKPDHRLPTMSIDEYLEEESRRGNILTGGGPKSSNVPTTSEQLAMDAEMDGNLSGEGKAEEKRLKDEKWAVFADSHPKGAGNTMNRG